jgi:hypothetical protein
LAEIDEVWPKCCIEVKGVKTKKDVEKFISKAMDEGFDVYAKVLPYRWFLVPETECGRGYAIYVLTHAFSDGIQALATIQ